MNKVKVLHIVSVMPVGGVGSYLKNVLRYINRNKYDLSFVICDKDENKPFSLFVNTYGCKCFFSYPLKVKNLVKIREWFNFFFAENKFDIVEIHSANLGFLCADAARKVGKAKVVFHFHSTKFSTNRLKGFRNYILELPLKKWADYYIACGQLVADSMLQKRNIDKSKYSVIQNAIEIKNKKYKKRQIEEFRNGYVDQNGKICLAIGNCVAVKNYFFLVKVFKLLENKYTDLDIVLLIAGDGDLRKALEENIENEGIKKIYLLGYREDTDFLMAASDMLVMPSLYEGLPVAAIEAQSNGLPALLSSTITKEVAINSNVHYLELDKGAEEWAVEIKKIIYEEKESNDKILASNYNIVNQIKNIEAIYSSLI